MLALRYLPDDLDERQVRSFDAHFPGLRSAEWTRPEKLPPRFLAAAAKIAEGNATFQADLSAHGARRLWVELWQHLREVRGWVAEFTSHRGGLGVWQYVPPPEFSGVEAYYSVSDVAAALVSADHEVS